MRANLPVTQREHDFPEHATLMSTTDVQSHVTYANAAFLAASGFSREELIGQPHNLVRHPDMPREAFADMWRTLQAGEAWSALVKNRRKDGDHYWVRANATPVHRAGRLVGYMSVRTKPGRREVMAAEDLYRRFREGRARGLRFHKGLVVRSGVLAWASAMRLLPVRWRIRLGLAATGAVSCAAAVALGAQPLAAGAMLVPLLACSAWLESQIARPLRGVLEQARRVAAGDPDRSMQMDRVDEIGMLMRAVNQAGLNTLSLVDDVADQIEGLGSASHQIAEGSSDLSARTEQAAASLEQTSAATRQMNANSRASVEAAGNAGTLAHEAAGAATRGEGAISEVVRTMKDISASARRIGDIIGLIDGIAFQTNILALNAAVEAARAKEQGRGFAVVAKEVRSLAAKSAEAARDIRQLIGASITHVEASSGTVQQAGDAMESIIRQVQRVNEFLAQMQQGAEHQAVTVREIDAAITQLDQSTQQNAALVEQSSAAAVDLRERTGRLAEAVQVYRG